MKKPGLSRAFWFSSDLIVAAVSRDSGCPDRISALYIYIPPSQGEEWGVRRDNEEGGEEMRGVAGEEKVHPILRRTRKIGFVICAGAKLYIPMYENPDMGTHG
jgi:hypothetical protein